MNALIMDMMVKMGSGKGGIAFANAIFGSKQGGRIATALGDPEVIKAFRDAINEHAEGYSQDVSDKRMAGFDGAVSRFEGATLNLQTALGRSFDANGKGGMLTGGTDAAAKFVQMLAEAPPQLQRLAFEASAAAAIFAGFKGAEALMGGFGMKGAAVALTEAARELMGAARLQTAERIPGGLPPGGGPPKKGVLSRLGRIAGTLPLIATLAETGHEGLSWLHDDVREDSGLGPGEGDRSKQFGPFRPGPKRVSMGGNAHAGSFHPLDGVKQGADEAKAAIDAVGETTVAPKVDVASITAASAAADALLAKLKQVPTAAAAAFAAVGRAAAAPMNVGTSAPGTGPAGRTPSGR